MNLVHSLRFLLIASSFLFASGIARWGWAEVSPLDLVSDSVALCLEVPRLEETWKRLEQSRVAERVQAFPPFQRFVTGASFQQWTALDLSVGAVTGQPLTQQLLGACAQSLVIAVYLPEGAKPQGLLIARARDESALRRAVESWGKLEPKHVDQSRQHLGLTYVQRAKSAKSKDHLYYALIGRTLVLSDQEALVRQAIELHQVSEARAASREPSVATERTLRASPLYRMARARLSDDAGAYLHVNARAWDKTLQADGNAEARNMLQVWRHVTAAAAALRFDEGLALDVVVELDRAKLPVGWSQFVQSTSGTTEGLRLIPADALLAVQLRGVVSPLIQWWLETDPETKSNDFQRGRRALRSLLAGRDLFDEVLPGVVSDVRLQLTERQDHAPRAVPFELLGVFAGLPEAGAANSADRSTMSDSLDNALQFGLNLLAVHLSSEQPELNVAMGSEATGATTVRFLKGLAFGEPAYGIEAGRLLVASSRASLSRGLSPASANAVEPQHAARLSRHEQRFFREMTQLVWLDAARTRQALATHSDWIAATLAQRNLESKPDIAARLTHLGEILQLFDSAFLAGRVEGDHIHVVVGGAID